MTIIPLKLLTSVSPPSLGSHLTQVLLNIINIESGIFVMNRCSVPRLSRALAGPPGPVTKITPAPGPLRIVRSTVPRLRLKCRVGILMFAVFRTPVSTEQIIKVHRSQMTVLLAFIKLCVKTLSKLPELPFKATRLTPILPKLVNVRPRQQLPLLGQCVSRSSRLAIVNAIRGE